MKIESMYKNNCSIKKDINEAKGLGSLSNKYLKVRCYSSTSNELLYTDLEVDLFNNEDEYLASFTIETIEDIETDFHSQVDSHRALLFQKKKKLYNYLKQHFDNVEMANDYTQ